MSEHEAAAAPPRALLLKLSPDEDFYIGWSESGQEPIWYGTRAAASRFAFGPDSIARADLTGTSSKPMLDAACTIPWEGKPFYCWESQGPVALQRGVLPRRFLRAFAMLYLAGEEVAAFDLVEPFEDDDAQVLHAH